MPEFLRSGITPTTYSDSILIVGPQSQAGVTGTEIFRSYGVDTTPASIAVVFNDSAHSPGYTITLLDMNQPTASGQYIEYWQLVRKSPDIAIWPDQVVRGGDLVKQGSGGASVYVLEDVEAPFLSTSAGDWTYILEVYTDSTTHAEEHDFSATIAQLEAFVDTTPGQAYLKMIEQITLSRYTFIEEFGTWKRPGSVLSESEVLGRKNKVVLTDVMRGKEGSFKIIVINDDGDPDIRSTIFDLEATLETGNTVLIQSTNYLHSGFKDLYCKITGVSISRHTTFEPMHDDRTTIFRVSVDFIEVDRPETSISISLKTWQQILDNNSSWSEVDAQHENWQSALLNPTL